MTFSEMLISSAEMLRIEHLLSVKNCFKFSNRFVRILFQATIISINKPILLI